jgi:hypothetical protein
VLSHPDAVVDLKFIGPRRISRFGSVEVPNLCHRLARAEAFLGGGKPFIDLVQNGANSITCLAQAIQDRRVPLPIHRESARIHLFPPRLAGAVDGRAIQAWPKVSASRLYFSPTAFGV